MKISSAFPSKWLKAADLNGQEVEVVIAKVVMEDLSGDGTDEKPVVYFDGKNKGLALNKTNAGVLSAAFGDETDNWIGKVIIIFPATVLFQSNTVPCLRVRIPAVKAAPGEEPGF